jgi:septum formation topological specificity factor MinE
MLKLILPRTELWNERIDEFEELAPVVIELEHSLISLSKWESNFQKPFLSNEKKTPGEILEYVYQMIITPDIDQAVLHQINQEILEVINNYIESKQSATTFGEMPKATVRSEVITSELIYYWMVAFNIPFECQYWHLNRLFSLIRICNIKQASPKKMSRNEIAERNRALNDERRAKYNTKG